MSVEEYVFLAVDFRTLEVVLPQYSQSFRLLDTSKGVSLPLSTNVVHRARNLSISYTHLG